MFDWLKNFFKAIENSFCALWSGWFAHEKDDSKKDDSKKDKLIKKDDSKKDDSKKEESEVK